MSSLRNLFITVVAFELILLSFGCQKSERFSEGGPKVALSFPLSDYYVSMSQAEQELNTIIGEVTPQLKSSHRRAISNKFTISSKGTKAGEDPVIMHVFNFGDDDGYAIMAGDSRVPSLLCFVEKGQFTQGHPDSDLEQFIMSELTGMYRLARLLPDSLKYETSPLSEDVISDIRTRGYVPVDTVYTDDRIYVYYSWSQNGNPIGTILETKWDQEAPFNNACPLLLQDTLNLTYIRAYAGCGPIAVTQIMAYWQVTPPSGHPYAGLNWNYISPIIDSTSTPTNYTGWLMLENLIRAVGDSCNLNASYKLDGTTTFTSNVPRTFSNFCYSSGGFIQDYRIDSVRNALYFGPVYGRGTSIRYLYPDGTIEDEAGHAWVFDQYYSRKRPVMVYDTSWHIITGQMLTDGLLHINWGWGGNWNGYFANSRFYKYERIIDPIRTKTPSVTLGSDWYYQYSLKINTGIRP